MKRRREYELFELIKRIKRVMGPYIAAKQAVVRERCALRLVDFMQQFSSGTSAVAQVGAGV